MPKRSLLLIGADSSWARSKLEPRLADYGVRLLDHWSLDGMSASLPSALPHGCDLVLILTDKTRSSWTEQALGISRRHGVPCVRAPAAWSKIVESLQRDGVLPNASNPPAGRPGRMIENLEALSTKEPSVPDPKMPVRITEIPAPPKKESTLDGLTDRIVEAFTAMNVNHQVVRVVVTETGIEVVRMVSETKPI